MQILLWHAKWRHKGTDQSGSGRHKSRKIREEWNKGESCMQTGCRAVCLWLSPVPSPCNLVYFHTKSFLNSPSLSPPPHVISLSERDWGLCTYIYVRAVGAGKCMWHHTRVYTCICAWHCGTHAQPHCCWTCCWEQQQLHPQICDGDAPGHQSEQ